MTVAETQAVLDALDALEWETSAALSRFYQRLRALSVINQQQMHEELQQLERRLTRTVETAPGEQVQAARELNDTIQKLKLQLESSTAGGDDSDCPLDQQAPAATPRLAVARSHPAHLCSARRR